MCDLHPDIARPCYACGANRARAAITPPPARDEDPDLIRARAIARARREARKEKP